MVFICPRPSSESLSRSVRDGVECLQGEVIDYGLLTTPQLHFIVASYNSGNTKVTEKDYYNHFAGAFVSLVKNVCGSAFRKMIE